MRMTSSTATGRSPATETTSTCAEAPPIMPASSRSTPRTTAGSACAARGSAPAARASAASRSCASAGPMKRPSRAARSAAGAAPPQPPASPAANTSTKARACARSSASARPSTDTPTSRPTLASIDQTRLWVIGSRLVMPNSACGRVQVQPNSPASTKPRSRMPDTASAGSSSVHSHSRKPPRMPAVAPARVASRQNSPSTNAGANCATAQKLTSPIDTSAVVLPICCM